VNGAGSSNLGFSAYRDYTILGGVIQGGTGYVYVDSDGDGQGDEIVTAVSDDAARTTGATLGQLMVDPNPFRGRTVIQWNRNVGVAKTIEVYRVDGRRVRSAPVGPAQVSFEWDGESDAGVRQAVGLYFIRIRDASGRVLGGRKVLIG
jgi:hypothetical protein